jgi:hypothetical protein
MRQKKKKNLSADVKGYPILFHLEFIPDCKGRGGRGRGRVRLSKTV